MAEAADLPQKIKNNDTEQEAITSLIRTRLMRLPNILHESVPQGNDDTANVEIRRVGAPRTFDFEVKNHGRVAADRGWADFERAAKISGAGFYFLKGSLVLLDLVLQRFALDLLEKRGFIPVIPPFMINRSSYEGVTDLDDFEKVMYKIDGDDAYLIATSEHPIAAMYQDEIFEEKDLPLRLCGLSPCFRRRSGRTAWIQRDSSASTSSRRSSSSFSVNPKTRGRSTRNCWQMPKRSLQSWISPTMWSISARGYRDGRRKKYDIEAWMPRENAYREVVSCSNCTSYQAASLNIRVRDKENFEIQAARPYPQLHGDCNIEGAAVHP